MDTPILRARRSVSTARHLTTPSRPHLPLRPDPFGDRGHRIARSIALAAALTLTAVEAPAQSDPDPPPDRPIAGTWDLVRSLGQPLRWKPFFSVGYGVDQTSGESRPGVTGSAGVRRAIGNPVVGLLGASAQGYVGHRGTELDAGAKLLLEAPAIFLSPGVDWNARLGRLDPTLGVTFPLRRGGWPLPGSEVRVEWLPTRAHSFGIEGTIPMGQPLAGRTRPAEVRVTLPRSAPTSAPYGIPGEPEPALTMGEVRASMRQLVTLLTFFWLIEHRSMRYESNVREWRAILADFSTTMLPASGERPGESRYQRLAETYHSALDRSFGIADGATEGTSDAERRGRPLAEAARRVALLEVVLPYNRSIGQLRRRNSLDGLRARARARYASWLQLDAEIDPARIPAVLAVMDAWLLELESVRAQVGDVARDPRMNWIPVGVALRPEEHRTQDQIDELVALALGERFESGNTAFTIDAPRFQWELRRTIHATRNYHVLWIHDYRGRNELGAPDPTGFETTLTYLRALRDAVRAYDSTGRFPTYLILLDQYFYEANDGRVWMTLLERPLQHRVRLGSGFAVMERMLELVQDSLRDAVGESVRLRAQTAAFGADWVQGLVKVHVNITNPADFTFRTRHLLGLPLGSDNMLRDHRKLVIRDVDESDPESGELILAGVGVGDHYTSATWDDRAMIVRGPGTVATRRFIRATLQRHRLTGANLPAPLRELATSDGRAERIAALEEAGATSRFIQAHNRTGWGAKDATFIQMLLYDLAPMGTLIVVPDGLWTSYQWMAQLVGAALRGCHVYVIAPARANAPSADFPQMAVMQDLITRLTLVEEVLGDKIRGGGGDLRVGLFARTVPLDSLSRSLEQVRAAWEAYPFLRARAPLSAESYAVFAAHAARLRAERRRETLIARDVRDRLPLLHRKTQWLIGTETLRLIVSAPVMPALLDRGLAGYSYGAQSGPPERPVPEPPRGASTRELMLIHASLPGPVQESPLYFLTGSINKNVRSMALDAEVVGVVAGPWVMETFLDLLLLTSSVTWIDSLEEVEELFPPYSVLQRRIGRWLHRIL